MNVSLNVTMNVKMNTKLTGNRRGHHDVLVRRSLISALSLAAALLTGCMPKSGASTSTGGISSADAASATRAAQLLQMTDQRRTDTAVVDAALSDRSTSVRARAALAIGQVKMRARYPALRAMLVDADTGVAANAAYAMGIGKDTAGVNALARALAGAPNVVSREAAWSLGEIGEPARTVLTVALGEGVSQPLQRSTASQRGASTRAALLLATVKLRPVPVNVVAPWLADTSAEVARAAAYVIGRQRIPAGVRALLTVRGRPDDETRQHVARGLAKSATGDSLATQARDALTVLLVDASPRVRANAARSMASFGPAVLRDMERALADVDANVRVAAAEVIGGVFGRDSMAWKRAWSRDSTYRVRQLLLVGARTAGIATLASGEKDWAARADWRYRMAVMESRAATDKADRLALAREYVKDADGRVRATAVGLIPPATSDGDARTLATGLLTDADVQVRAAALGLIARRARAEDVDIGITHYERAAKEADGDARTAALRVIAAAWTRDSTRIEPTVRQRLATLTWNAPTTERRIVANVTPMATWARADLPSTTRPLSDYERLVRRWDVPGAKQPLAIIRTERGDVTIELFGADAPLIVESFIRLATTGYYRNSYFHRVVPNFVVQDGDSRGDGSGGAGFTLRESWTRRRHERGAVGLATSGPDTGGSQYYLTHSSQPHLDGGYTVFGRVIEGFDVMDRIVQGDRMVRVDIR